jgi:hypothetical protein
VSKKHHSHHDHDDDTDNSDDEEDEEPPELTDTGANTLEIEKVDKEIEKQLKKVCKMNPFLQAIIENANKISLENDLKENPNGKPVVLNVPGQENPVGAAPASPAPK